MEGELPPEVRERLKEVAREALDEASKETERSNLVPPADDGFLSLWRPLD